MATGITFKNTLLYHGIINYLNSDINYYIMLFITALTIGSAIAYFFESATGSPKETN